MLHMIDGFALLVDRTVLLMLDR